MKKSSTSKLNNLPISKNAYTRFTARIIEVLKSDQKAISTMCAALDRYLSGDTDAADSLPPTLRMAFCFLQHDIDIAIQRSTRARMRARLRKASSTSSPSASSVTQIEEASSSSSTTIVSNDAPSADSFGPTSAETSRPLTRQQRRALERAARRKESRPGPTGNEPSYTDQ